MPSRAQTQVDMVCDDLAPNWRRASMVAGDTHADAEDPRAQLRPTLEASQAQMDGEKDALGGVHRVGLTHAQPTQRAPNEVEVFVVDRAKIGSRASHTTQRAGDSGLGVPGERCSKRKEAQSHRLDPTL